MTSRSLKLATDLSLPLDAVTQKLAWLGVTGSGKTYGASKLAELLWAAGAQFIVVDPVGVWYGLRLAKNGKTPSDLTIPIFGGLHGDVPLEATGGALLANLVVDKTLSAIIDVSQFENDTDKARFARDFADRFFFRKKAAPSAVHLFLEECQEFVPQNPQKGEEHMLHAYIRMQKLGRNFGIGSSYISQRPQEVNKKALNMAQTLFVFRTTGTHERKAIEAWIADKSLDQDIANDLPKIATGDCHVWSPEFLKISDTVRILEKHTFNASATPEVGVTAKARELAPIDLDQVRAEMAATIEKAKAEDPRELRRRIEQLEKQLKSKSHTAPKEKRVEIAILKPAEITRLERAIGRYEVVAEALARPFGELIAALVSARSAVHAGRLPDRVENPPRRVGVDGRANHRGTEVPEALGNAYVRRRAHAARSASVNSDATLGKGQLRILTAIAQHDGGVTREQLTVLTAYKKSSRDTYLQQLQQQGLVTTNGHGTLVATPAGLETLGPDFEALPTGNELRYYWLARLPQGERVLLEALTAAHPKSVDRDTLSETTGYKKSSRDTYLQKLAARKLITTERDGVRAAEELFS